MKKWLITLGILGATVAVTALVVKKLGAVLEALHEDQEEFEDELMDPPPEIKKAMDEAMASYPDGWTIRGRPDRPVSQETSDVD